MRESQVGASLGRHAFETRARLEEVKVCSCQNAHLRVKNTCTCALLLTPAYAVQLMLAHLRAYWPVNIRAYWLQYEITFQADSDALLLSFFDYVLQTAVSALCNLQHSVCVW